jgi:glutaminyl-tRNA synthetase
VDAEILAREPKTTEFFRSAVAEHAARPGEGGGGPAVLANWIINVLPPVIGDRPLDELPFRPADFAALVALVEGGVVSGGAGTAILEVMARDGGDPRELMERLDLRQVSDADALAPLVEAIVGEFPDKVREYRDGKTGLVGFFIGNVMRRSGGKADPRVVRELLERALK